MEAAGHNEALHNSLQNIWQHITDSDTLPDLDKEVLYSNIIAAAAVRTLPVRSYTWLKWAAAAVLVLALGSMAWMYLSKKDQPPQKSLVLVKPFKNNRAAQISKSILSLTNGSEIVLDDAPNGTLVKQGSTTIIKLNRQLVYKNNRSGKKAGAALNYNILTTPPGSQYEVVLPDESHVWVNAATALRFPTEFNDNERVVALTGEAYFEVATDAAHPFRVKLGAQTVEVLGTHFNINAYSDEGVIRTTLLEGKIKMGDKIILPGQQLQVNAAGQTKLVPNADTEQAVAWKNGLFQFDNADLPSVMRQLTRWYNVDVRYPAHMPQRSFGGAIQRSLPLTKVLAILEDNDVTFAIEGNTITVLP
jgi:ferric-dicitrate binding protein FerR (iron transport regulator)